MCCFFLRFVGYPGNYYTLFGIRNEDVSVNCIKVATISQLVVKIMIAL